MSDKRYDYRNNNRRDERQSQLPAYEERQREPEDVLASGKIDDPSERKTFYFDLKSNRRGTVLRIKESSGCGRTNMIMIPITSLERACEVMDEMLSEIERSTKSESSIKSKVLFSPSMKLTIPLSPVKSSQIAGVGYHPETGTLAIQFKKGGLYHYSNVSPDDYNAFKGAKSVGSHFFQNIKPYPEKYPYVKQA